MDLFVIVPSVLGFESFAPYCVNHRKKEKSAELGWVFGLEVGANLNGRNVLGSIKIFLKEWKNSTPSMHLPAADNYQLSDSIPALQLTLLNFHIAFPSCSRQFTTFRLQSRPAADSP
jgi:hypothetical protein